MSLKQLKRKNLIQNVKIVNGNNVKKLYINTQLWEPYSPIIPACGVQHFQWPDVEVMYCLYWIRHLSHLPPGAEPIYGVM